MRLGKLAWAIGLGVVLLACKSEEPRPAAPPSVGHGNKPDTGGVNPGGKDASAEPIDASIVEDSAVTDTDAGDAGDAGISPTLAECQNVAVVSVIETDSPDAKLVNAITAPTDFKVSRVLSSWGPSCMTPTIEIVMSDGSCPNGAGHELRFTFSALDIVGGNVTRGANTLTAEPDSSGIKVRYMRSDDVDPTGVWGSCKDAIGTISLRDDLDVNDLDHIEGSFQLQLTGCEKDSLGVQVVNGSFDADMRRSLDDVCPSMK